MRCYICKRGPRTSLKRSYSKKATKRRQLLNLQTKTINGKKVKICIRCLKTLYKSVKQLHS